VERDCIIGEGGWVSVGVGRDREGDDSLLELTRLSRPSLSLLTLPLLTLPLSRAAPSLVALMVGWVDVVRCLVLVRL
jgi:hypothetical protein